MSGHEIKVLIVDDEPPARERLERLLVDLPGWEVAASCATGSEALELVGQLHPEIVLLDIQMPGMSGIEAARHLSTLASPPAVIFTTAYDRYALEAFDSQAVGYLLKPVRRERLASALRHAARLKVPQLSGLAAAGPAPRRHVAARLGERLRLIPVKEVVFFRAEQKYVTVVHQRGEDIIEESLKDLEAEFGDAFVRAHRSLLVAAGEIEALERDAEGRYSLRLRNRPERFDVSRRQLADLKRRLGLARGERNANERSTMTTAAAGGIPSKP